MSDVGQAGRGESRPERILLVEDDEFSNQLIEMYLRKAGFSEVGIARDGREALEVAAATPFDLMLLDLNLPRLNGAEVLRRLRKNNAMDQMAVLVITSLTNVEETAHCMEQGAEDFLPKPFNRILLENRVLSILERRKLRQDAAAAAEEARRRAELNLAADSLGLEAALAVAGRGVAGRLLTGRAGTGARADLFPLPGGGAVVLLAELAEPSRYLAPAVGLALAHGRQLLAADPGTTPRALVAAMGAGPAGHGVQPSALRLGAYRLDREAGRFSHDATGQPVPWLLGAAGSDLVPATGTDIPLAGIHGVMVASQALSSPLRAPSVRASVSSALSAAGLVEALSLGATASGGLASDGAAIGFWLD